MLRFTKAGLL